MTELADDLAAIEVPMHTELRPNSAVVLTPHARFYRAEQDYVLITPRADFRFRGQSAVLFDKVKFLLDGAQALNVVVRNSGVPFAELQGILKLLIEDGALSDITHLLAAKRPDQFLDAYFQLCDEWALDIFSRPFWERMMSGQASQSLVFGWGLEFYHRVMGADEHNAISVNFCEDKEAHQWLTAHFAEEVDHGYMFLDGLATCGFSRQAVIQSPALPSTTALINFLNALAATDLISYLGCYGVMHSPRVGQTRENIDRQYNLLKQHYGFAFGLIDKIHHHAVLDIDLGHDGIVFEKVITRHEVIPRALPIKLLGAIKGIVTAFGAFFDGIYEYYDTPTAQLPRRAAIAN